MIPLKKKKGLKNIVLNNGEQEHHNIFGQFSCYFCPPFTCLLLLILFQKWDTHNVEISKLEIPVKNFLRLPTIRAGPFWKIISWQISIL